MKWSAIFTYIRSLSDPTTTLEIILMDYIVEGGKLPDEVTIEIKKQIALMDQPNTLGINELLNTE